jgi:hypothetical protein
MPQVLERELGTAVAAKVALKERLSGLKDQIARISQEKTLLQALYACPTCAPLCVL